MTARATSGDTLVNLEKLVEASLLPKLLSLAIDLVVWLYDDRDTVAVDSLASLAPRVGKVLQLLAKLPQAAKATAECAGSLDRNAHAQVQRGDA